MYDEILPIPPGATIKEQLVTRDITPEELAEEMDMSQSDIDRLLGGKTILTLDIAKRLEAVLGIPVSFWIEMEIIYREKQERLEIIRKARQRRLSNGSTSN